MPRPKGSTNKNKSVKKKPNKNKITDLIKPEEKEQVYCRCCQKHKHPTHFYEATSILDANGYMSICKDCCLELYEKFFAICGTLEEALFKTCQVLDICFYEEALNATKSHLEKLLASGKPAERVFGYYKSKLSSTARQNGLTDFSFANSDKLENTVYKDRDDDFLIDEEIKKYWGKGKLDWEYEFLVEEMEKIKSSFECPDYGMEMIMKDISFINLEIEKTRQGGKGDVTKLIDARSKLMNDANMKPVQSTGADANDQVSLGTFIKKWESEKPVPKRLDDEMKKYIDTYMVGQLAKIEGINGDLLDNYEKSLKEHTIDFSEIYEVEEEVPEDSDD
jgi:hypothetical protein